MSQISIIIPVYNAQEYLRRCLDSIQQQTFSDFEAILINDGSKDKSLEICVEYSEKDKRFKIINQDNMGPSHARNRGIDEATSKYLAFVDSDDYIASNMLEELYVAAESSSADLTICGFYSTSGNEEGSIYYTKYAPGVYCGEELKKIAADALNVDAVGNIRPYSGIRLVKKDCLESPRLRFNAEIYRSEDYLLWSTLFARTRSVCLITDKPLYYYVVNQTSITHRYIENYWQMAKMIYHELKSVYADDAVAQDRLNIMLMRRAYMSLHIAALAENQKQLYRDVRSVLTDKDLRLVIRQIPFKKGISSAKIPYILLKFRFYFIIKLIYIFKYFKNH
ncbi:MAG: glycosyltransferase [Lachnospiraceae bacterium]|nr:glycosyltransferase [Lachnospiraceae bacterium]MBQ8797042.1 glycosyltransferase [Oscillospiraceae bacterium]